MYLGSLAPKHHFLIHYAGKMKLFGPLSKISCLPYERKHREGKMTALWSSNRINVYKTMALKHQLIMNHYFLRKLSDPFYESGTSKSIYLQEIPHFKLFASALPLNINPKVSMTKWIEFLGQYIKAESILITPCEDGPKLLFIRYILLEKNHEVIAVIKVLEHCYFSRLFQAFEIESYESNTWNILTCKDIISAIVTHKARLNNGKEYIFKNWV